MNKNCLHKKTKYIESNFVKDKTNCLTEKCIDCGEVRYITKGTGVYSTSKWFKHQNF